MPELTADDDPYLGEVFDDRYEVLERIGEGGMGVVYRARHQKMDRLVALKVLHEQRSQQDTAVARFMREMRTTSKINHPNVVNVYDFGETRDGDFFLAMELVQGETLRDRLDREGSFDLPRACGIGMQILAALGAAHKEGIVHRDLKPENIMLMESHGEADQVRVLDFGIARYVEGHEDAERSRVTRTGSFVGTPHFASPEQAVGDELDGRSDLYAFGVLMFRMVTGKLPFDAPGKPLRVLRMQMTERAPLPSSMSVRDVPAWFDDLLMELLEKFPEDRPETAARVAQQMAVHLGVGETLEIADAATHLQEREPAANAPAEHSSRTVLVAALVAAVVAGIGGLLVGYYL